MREVFPETAEQRCWFTIANVLAALPKPPHPGAKKALARDLGRLVLLARTGFWPQFRDAVGPAPGRRSAPHLTHHLCLWLSHHHVK